MLVYVKSTSERMFKLSVPQYKVYARNYDRKRFDKL